MSDKLDIKPLIQAFKKARRTLPIKLGQGAVLFFKDNIRKRQGFLDQRLEKWKPLKRKRRGKGGRIKRGQDILKDTGTLLKSISRVITTFKEIRIATKGVDYGVYHNEGIGVKQRQFIGNSKQLEKALQRKIDRELRGFLKKA